MHKFILSSILFLVFTISCTPTATDIPVTSVGPTETKYSFNKVLTSRYSSAQYNVSFLIPDSWYVDENETGINISANQTLRSEDNLSFSKDEAIIFLRITERTGTQLYDEGTMIDMLNDLPPYLPPGKERAHIIILNGKMIAFAGYGINKPIPYPSFTAITLLEEKVVLGLIFTSIASERSFRGIFQDMIASIESTDIP
jgi:hypothetical protein